MLPYLLVKLVLENIKLADAYPLCSALCASGNYMITGYVVAFT